MSSSQALAQSVFANLEASGSLHLLCGVKDDEGQPLIDAGAIPKMTCSLECDVERAKLGEPRPTSLDVCFSSRDYTVAFECKLTEADVGTCYGPRRERDDPLFCEGAYVLDRPELRAGVPRQRCPLSEANIKYWTFVPLVFNWPADGDMPVCPLDANYQLVRNVLAVTVSTTGVSSATNGHIVLIYDGRNPAFAEGGRGHAAYLETKRALRPAYAHALRRCRWQTLVGALRDAQPTSWLAAELALKYGF